MAAPSPDALHRTIGSVWRIEAARIIARVARMTRDVGRAEELAQDALVAALEHWPSSGLPDNPAAWLMTTARNRALDHLRQQAMQAREHEALGHDMEALEAQYTPDFVDALDAARQDDIGDDLLRLIFTACHPVLSTEARVALTLRLLGGLSTVEIARAFLVPEATVAQRIVRAKRSLTAAHVPFEVPGAAERAPRLASVLEVIYLVFNEGYAATAGDDWMRPALCDEALRLVRVLAGLTPDEPEVQGLVALLEIQASRLPARTDAEGRPVLLMDQDRARWDHLLVRRGLAALDRAEQLARAGHPGGPTRCRAPSRPAMRAHAVLRTPTGTTSWHCTTRCCRLRPHPSWRSTAPWPWAWPTGPPPHWCWSMHWAPTPPCATTTGCPACVATCWPSWTAVQKRVPSSNWPPRLRTMRRNSPCCGPARQTAARDRTGVTGCGFCRNVRHSTE